MIRGGLLSGRQMRSPVPVHMARPSESWISGRQSMAVVFDFSEYQYMEVSGAMPRRLDLLAQEDRAFDVHDHGFGALHDETVGAGDARSIEKRVHRDRVGAGLPGVSK